MKTEISLFANDLIQFILKLYLEYFSYEFITIKRVDYYTHITIFDNDRTMILDFFFNHSYNRLTYSFYVDDYCKNKDYLINKLNKWKSNFIKFIEEISKKFQFEIEICEEDKKYF